MVGVKRMVGVKGVRSGRVGGGGGQVGMRVIGSTGRSDGVRGGRVGSGEGQGVGVKGVWGAGGQGVRVVG